MATPIALAVLLGRLIEEVDALRDQAIVNHYNPSEAPGNFVHEALAATDQMLSDLDLLVEHLAKLGVVTDAQTSTKHEDGGHE